MAKCYEDAAPYGTHVYLFKMWGGELEPTIVEALSFDEAFEKAREIDPGYCAGYAFAIKE